VRVALSFWQWVIHQKAKGQFVKRAYKPGLTAIDYALKSDWWKWDQVLSFGGGQSTSWNKSEMGWLLASLALLPVFGALNVSQLTLRR
jgi:hypothetical protein